MSQEVTQGRIVNYHNPNGETHSAIVAKVLSPECVNLAITDHEGSMYNATSVMKDSTDVTKGSWSWPVRN